MPDEFRAARPRRRSSTRSCVASKAQGEATPHAPSPDAPRRARPGPRPARRRRGGRSGDPGRVPHRLGADDGPIAAGLALARVLSAGRSRAAAPLYPPRWNRPARIRPTARRRQGLDGVGPVAARRRGLDRGRGVLREALAIREAEKPQHWATAEVRSLLGGALFGQKKTAEAAPLLRSGYEGMARSAAAIQLVDRPRLAEASTG